MLQELDKIKVIEVVMDKQKAGRLALTPDYLCAFEYDPLFLQNGFSISPFYLPLESGVFAAKRDPFNGSFGVFSDSLPDGWGALILDRYLRNKGIDVRRLNPLQRLAIVGTSGRGALEYYPDLSVFNEKEAGNLEQLAQYAQKITTSAYEGEGISTLYKHGGSPGGARPKVFLTIEDTQWLVKFRAANDPPDIGETEYKYSQLAKKCGIKMPETRLFENKYFGTRRFDRTNTGKIHTISAAGLLNADYRTPSLDYSSLLQACQQLTKNMQETEQLFRIMVFNAAIENKDDHAKNFSFQYVDGNWKVAPAYDLLPSAGFNNYHTTTVNNNENPTHKDLLAVAAQVGLSLRKSRIIIDEIYSIARG